MPHLPIPHHRLRHRNHWLSQWISDPPSLNIDHPRCLAQGCRLPEEDHALVVCKLDRMARSTQYLLKIVERVERKGAHLHCSISGWT
jgi:hypothetical protein